MKDSHKRILRRIKVAATVIVLAGVVIHLFMVYEAAKSIEIVDKKIIGIYPKYLKPDEYEVKFSLALKNPKRTEIEIDYISYEVYIEDEFVGKGEKPRFIIQHGMKNYTFLLSFNILNLTTPTKNLLLNGGVNIIIKGEVIIPAKFLGLFTWRYIKLPYTIHDIISVSL